MGFDSGAELDLSGEDQNEKPEGGITSVPRDKVIRFQMVYMLGSQGPFSSHFRTDDGIYDNAVQCIDQMGDSCDGTRLSLCWIPCPEMIGNILCAGDFNR